MTAAQLLEHVAKTAPFAPEEVVSRAEADQERITHLLTLGQRGSMRSPARGSRSRATLLVAAALALLLIPTIAIASLGLDLGFSNKGSEVEPRSLDYESVRILERVGATGTDVRLLGERSGVQFFGARSRTGEPCFAVGQATRPGPRFQQMTCLGPGVDAFPSQEQPVLDFSTGRVQLGSNEVRLDRIAGFAADAIARVGIVDVAGVTHWVEVRDNLYLDTDPPKTAAVRLLAANHGGETVWSRTLSVPVAMANESGLAVSE